MKKMCIAVLLLSSIAALGQNSGFGIKGGLNYGSVGDLQVRDAFRSETFSKENKAGYHFGIFYKAELGGLFIQPEILYTKVNTDYSSDNPPTNGTFNFEVQKIDAPILVGLDLIGPLNIKAGPSLQYILDTGFGDNDFDFSDPDQKITVGYQLGIGLTIDRLGFDLRYEGAFSENDTTFTDILSDPETNFTVDSRPSQWILTLSYSLDKD